MKEEITQELKEHLEKEVQRYRIEISNLKAQEHSSRVNLEAQKKVDDNKNQIWLNEKKKELSLVSDKLDSRENILKIKEDEVSRREVAVEKKEQENVDLGERRKAFLAERADFIRFKREMDMKISRGREVIEESKLVKKVLNQKASDLLMREEGVIKSENHWSDKMYELKEFEKLLKVREANIEALKVKET